MTSGGPVSNQAVIGDTDAILAGNTVVGTPIESAALGCMWAMGRGAQLIPSYMPAETITEGNSVRYRFMLRPRSQCVDMVWVINARGTGGAVGGAIIELTTDVDGGTVTTKQYSVGDQPFTVWPVLHHQLLDTVSTSVMDARITIEAIDGDVVVDGIACYEAPRSKLAYTANDGGIDPTTLRFRNPIYNGSRKSLGGVATTVTKAFSSARKAGLFMWATGDTTGTCQASTTSTSSSNGLFRAGVPMLGRKLYTSSTTATVTVYVQAAYATGAARTGSVTFTPVSSGSTTTLTINQPTFEWYNTTFTIDCTDLTATDGRRSTRWDDVTVNFYTQNAADTLYVASVCCFEDEP